MFSTQQYFGFDPRTIPGCELWLDAADSRTIQFASGSNISNWIDKSGRGRNFSNANAATQPTLQTTGLSGTSNNVFFDTANNGYLTNSSFSGFSNTTFDVYSVVRIGNAGNQAALFWGQPATLQMIINVATGDTGQNNTFHTSGVWRLTPTEGYNSSAIPHIFNVYSTGTQIGRRYQGTDFGLTNQVATYSFPGFSASEVTFFRPVSGGWSTTSLRVGEVLLFSRVLSTSERQQVEGYLGWKWSIQTQYAHTTSFLPTSIAGCQLWLDAADLSTFTPANPATGTQISQWNDKSGNAKHVSNGLTDSQPRYRISNVTNGYPSVHFDSTSATASFRGRLSNSTFTGLNTSTWDVFAAMTVQSAGSTALIWDDPSSLQHIIACYTTSSTGANNILHTTGTWRLTPTTGYIEPNTPRIVETYSTGTQVGRRVNGYFYGNSGTQVANYAFPTRTGGRPFFIANPTGGWSSGNLFLNELIIYDSVLSDSDRSNVQNYLRVKWGITDGIIPASHPMYYNPTTMRMFQPVDVSDCYLWLDAADAGTIDFATGSNITTWRDKSGRGCNATQTVVGRYPTYDATNRRVNFTQVGSNVFFNLPNSALPFGSRYTYYTVICFTTTPAVSLNFISGGTAVSGTSNTAFIWSIGSTRSISVNWYNNSFSSPSNSYTVNIPLMLMTDWDGTTTRTIVRNGTQIATNNPTVTTRSQDTTSNVIGAFMNGASGLEGYINEIVIYNRQITATENRQIEGYLAAKWGLSGSLPTTQPYYLRQALPNTPLLTPTSFSNVELWLDAADLTTFTFSSGSNVIQWNDKSDRGRHAITDTGTPVLTTNLSLPGVYFNVASMTGSFAYSNVSTLTVFIVATIETDAGDTGRLISIANDDTTDDFNNGTANQALVTRNNADTNITTRYSGLARGTRSFSSYATPFIVSAVSTGAAYGYRVNGATVTNQTRTGNYSTRIYRISRGIGPIGGAASGQGKGFIFEVILIRAALTDYQRQQVEGYLAWKWNLQDRLLTTHPFKDFRP